MELAKRWQSYTIIQHAIQLLLEGPGALNEEERKPLRKLVQKYEPRLLAMSMNMHRPTPLGFVKRILASVKCAPMY